MQVNSYFMFQNLIYMHCYHLETKVVLGNNCLYCAMFHRAVYVKTVNHLANIIHGQARSQGGFGGVGRPPPPFNVLVSFFMPVI